MIKSAFFLGSKKFGFNIFSALYRADPAINWTILCPPDHNDTRTYFTEFEKFSKSHELDLHLVVSPERVRQLALDLRPDTIIVCGYYRILPAQLIDSVPMGVWGIHNSLLPKYRGGSPLVWQLINREQIIGSSLFKLSDGVDDGVILDQVRIDNSPNLSVGEASDQLEQEWMKRIPKIWKDFLNGNIYPHEQAHDEATYCAQRQHSDGLIKWHMTASEIDAFIRAQDHPYPRAFFRFNDRDVKIVKHKIDPRRIYGVTGQVFEVLSEYVTICCAEDTAIRLYEVESGGERMIASDVLNSIKIRLS